MTATTMRARAALVLCATVGGVLSAAPLDNRFTYQGQLKQNGAPVHGPTDFEFSLWDQAGLGIQIGPTVTANSVSLENGLFPVDLDFGEFAFDSEERWLQVTVRHPAGVGDFVPLERRQRITATPYTLGLRVPMSTTGVGDDDLFTIKHNGSAGSAGSFQNISFSNLAPALEATAGGLAPAFAATSFTGTAVSGTATAGRAGYFFSQGSFPTLAAINNSSGPAISSDGNIVLADDTSTIVFPATDASNAPMIEMFASGTLNAARMVIAHSPGASSWGLQYEDVFDKFHFLRAGSDVMTVDLANSRVGVGTADPGRLLDVGGRMRVREGGGTAGIWFYQTTPAADRAFVGMYDDDTMGLYGNTGAGWSLLLNTTTGDVGIGTPSPQAPLHILSTSDAEPGGGGILVLGSTFSGNVAIDGNEIMARNNGATSPLFLNNDGGNIHMAVVSGGVSIGTTTIPAGVLLAVDGKVLCEEMEVQLSGDWPDFVFAADYSLMPLDELERAVDEHKHLPGIPSAAEVAKEGLNVGEMQIQLLRKVEELTLYVIEVNKQVEAVRAENQQLRERISQLEGGQ